MFDFGIFCHLLRLMGIYRVGPRPGIWKVSFHLFFSSFFFILHFHCFCLSLGAPLASGPLDIVHPCQPVATPLQFGLWMFFILLHRYMVSKTLKSKKKKRKKSIFTTSSLLYSIITPPLKVPLFNACAAFPNVSRYYQAWSTPHFWTVRVGYGRVAHSVARILNGKITSEKICILKTIFLYFRPMSPRYSGTKSKLRCRCFHCRNLRWGT